MRGLIDLGWQIREKREATDGDDANAEQVVAPIEGLTNSNHNQVLSFFSFAESFLKAAHNGAFIECSSLFSLHPNMRSTCGEDHLKGKCGANVGQMWLPAKRVTHHFGRIRKGRLNRGRI